MTNVHRTVLGAVPCPCYCSLPSFALNQPAWAQPTPWWKRRQPRRARRRGIGEAWHRRAMRRAAGRSWNRAGASTATASATAVRASGPNLSDIGGRRTLEQLRQALVAPDDEVLPENRSVRLVTRDGAAVTGRLLNQDAISVQLITSSEELKTYLKDGLREYAILDKGLMPSVRGKLTDPQVADVVSYLGSLKAELSAIGARTASCIVCCSWAPERSGG